MEFQTKKGGNSMENMNGLSALAIQVMFPKFNKNIPYMDKNNKMPQEIIL